MLLLNQARRAMLVDKMPDVANLAIGALSFGQFLPIDLSRLRWHYAVGQFGSF